MKATRNNLRGWRVAALILGGLVLSIGCNPLTTIAFILEPERLVDPKCPLADPEKEIKVAVLVYHASLVTAEELSSADTDLGGRVVNALEERYKENKDKVKIIHPSQVRGFLSRNPDWQLMSRQEIGKSLGVDYVINVEIGKMTFFEPRSFNQFYHGQAELKLTVIDVQKPAGEGERWSDSLPCDFPKAGPLEVGEMKLNDFRNRFLDNTARKIAERFAAYPPKHQYDSDRTE